MSRPTYRIPGNIRVSTRFFGRFTWKDLLRIGLPILLATSQLYGQTPDPGTALTLLTAATGTGTAWYLYRPYGRPVDVHLYHGVRWLLQKYVGDGVDVAEEHDDHLVLEGGTVVGLIEIAPTNLDMKTDAEQEALHSILRELFGSISYPVTLHSRQEPLDLHDYIDHIASQDLVHEQHQADYLDYCQTLASGELTRTRHIISVRVTRDDLTWLQNQLPGWLPIDRDTDTSQDVAVNELDSRCRDIVQKLDSTELSADRITGTQFARLADTHRLYTNRYSPTWTGTPYNDTMGEYRRTLSVTEFPSTARLGWPLTLLRANGLVDVTQTIYPENSAATAKTLRRISEKLDAEINSLLSRGYHSTSKLETLLDDVEWFQALLADREDHPVEYGVTITVRHPDKDRCSQTFEQVCNRLNTLQIDYQQPVFRTDQARHTANPLYRDRLDDTQLMPAGSAAAGFPWATQDTDHTTGVIYGVDQADQTPVLLDRFTWSSHSMARMGMVGSGKSYAAKLELLRAALIYDDLQVIVVDPKQEYQHLVQTLGGTIQSLESDASYSFDQQVTGFTVPERGRRENVDLLTGVVEQIYQEVSQDERKTLVLIDEARILLNDEQGRQVLNQFVLEGRDTNTAITLITQNASHFTHSREGREILDNMPGKVFMRHDRVPDSVVDYFDLSQREQQGLFELKTGTDAEYSEALLRVAGRLNTQVRIEATPQEHAIIQAGEGQT